MHVLYPDFAVDPKEGSCATRNIKVQLPESIAFQSVNLLFSRHVAKEDMDAVRLVGQFFGELDLDARHLIVRRDSAFLEETLDGEPLDSMRRLSEDELVASLNNLKQSVIAVGLGSNLITRTYNLMPGALIHVGTDLVSEEGYFEQVGVLAQANAMVLKDDVKTSACRSIGLPADRAAVSDAIASHWKGCVDVVNAPLRVGGDDALNYRFRSCMDDGGEHFGFIIRVTTDGPLQRRVFIIGGSGPIGTRAAGDYFARNGQNLAVMLAQLGESRGAPSSERADFVAVVHVTANLNQGPHTIDLIPPTTMTEPELVYMVARPHA